MDKVIEALGSIIKAQGPKKPKTGQNFYSHYFEISL